MALTERTNKGFGWRPDLPDYRDHEFRLTMASPTIGALALPQTSIIPAKKLPPVFNQGNLGSCVGNSIATMMAFTRKVSPRSRLQIYYEARRLINETHVDEGAYIRDGIKVIANLGAGRETWWPYDESKVFVDPPLKVDRDALLRKVFSYSRLENREDFRKCLAEGFPFVIGFSVYSAFMSARVAQIGILNLPKRGETMSGGHAVCVIGYDGNFRESQWAKDAVAAGMDINEIPNDVYIVRNSWGEEWGRKGDFAVDAAYFENRNLAADSWTIRNK